MEFSFIKLLLLALVTTTATHHRRRAGFCAAEFFSSPHSIPAALNNTAGPWDGFHSFSGCRAGKSYDGLAKLKKYFNHFGYIPAAPENFSDEFDDSFESAVKLYQQNFRLNVTGQLDDATLRQIVRPRCGVADIINGINSMADQTAPSQLNIVARYSFFMGAPLWPSDRRHLTYAFLDVNQFNEAARSAVARAFGRWAAVVPFTFTEVADYSAADNTPSADIKIAAYYGDHGDGWPFDGVGGAIGHSFAPTNGRYHIDKAEHWVVTGDVTQSTVSTAMDFESSAMHEIGHLLGLYHSNYETAIMYPTLMSLTRKVELSDDDINGIQSLYGSSAGSYATTRKQNKLSTSVSGACVGGGLVGAWFAAAVALHYII